MYRTKLTIVSISDDIYKPRDSDFFSHICIVGGLYH